jgi:hypothetical protein
VLRLRWRIRRLDKRNLFGLCSIGRFDLFCHIPDCRIGDCELFETGYAGSMLGSTSCCEIVACLINRVIDDDGVEAEIPVFRQDRNLVVSE